MNGTTWETQPLISIVVTQTGSTTNTYYTNFTAIQIGAAGYIRTKASGNANDGSAPVSVGNEHASS